MEIKSHRLPSERHQFPFEVITSFKFVKFALFKEGVNSWGEYIERQKEWCEESIGHHDETWTMVVSVLHEYWYFSEEKYAILFSLRWL